MVGVHAGRRLSVRPAVHGQRLLGESLGGRRVLRVEWGVSELRWVARLWILARLLWVLGRLGRLSELLLLLARLLWELARLERLSGLRLRLARLLWVLERLSGLLLLLLAWQLLAR